MKLCRIDKKANLVKANPPKNKAELAFCNQLGPEWICIRKGWPDFFCLNKDTGKIMLVEVKPRKTDKLSRYQRFLMNELSKAGVACARWAPDGGYNGLSHDFGKLLEVLDKSH